MCQKPNALLQCTKFQKMNVLKFWAIDIIWPTLDKFYYYYLHMWFLFLFLKAYIKFRPNLFHLIWGTKGKSKTSHRIYELKDEFGNPRSEPLCFKWEPSHAWTLFWNVFGCSSFITFISYLSPCFHNILKKYYISTPRILNLSLIYH